jgi:hypothetical protein
MKLTERVLEKLAEIVVGDHPDFPCRSSSYITKFFNRCGLPFVHDRSTRRTWTQERLAELNLGTAQSPDLPSEDLLRVIAELLDSDDNLDSSGRCHPRNTGIGANSHPNLIRHAAFVRGDRTEAEAERFSRLGKRG